LRIIRQIPQALRAAGHVVPPPPALRPAGSIVERAHDLKAYLNDLQHPAVFGQRVHLIAHSMGGLDARYMIARLGMAPRIVSLTTIGTPHHGSPIADVVSAGTHPLLSRFVEHLGVDIRGLADLTTAACERFNLEVLDVPTVPYFSIAGRFTPPHLLGAPVGILGLSHDVLQARAGDNDGLVAVQSATFGQCRQRWTFLETWEGNHFRLINWGLNLVPSPAELGDETIVDNYKALVTHLRGFE
jgi:triacylglycerol lipase